MKLDIPDPLFRVEVEFEYAGNSWDGKYTYAVVVGRAVIFTHTMTNDDSGLSYADSPEEARQNGDIAFGEWLAEKLST